MRPAQARTGKGPPRPLDGGSPSWAGTLLSRIPEMNQGMSPVTEVRRYRLRSRGPWLAGDSTPLRSRPCARSLPFRSTQFLPRSTGRVAEPPASPRVPESRHSQSATDLGARRFVGT